MIEKTKLGPMLGCLFLLQRDSNPPWVKSSESSEPSLPSPFSVYFDIQLLNELFQMKHIESEQHQQQQQQQHEVVLNAVLSITSNAAAFFMVRSHLVFSFGFTVESKNDVLSVLFCFVCLFVALRSQDAKKCFVSIRSETSIH